MSGSTESTGSKGSKSARPSRSAAGAKPAPSPRRPGRKPRRGAKNAPPTAERTRVAAVGGPGVPAAPPGRAHAAELLEGVGAYGFARTAVPILAALVTEDPLLLIGPSGTGKTFLLNSISEVLGLEHRHYNASLLSFDDLVGFPYPDEARSQVRFLETPATVWGAESVLIDEISRCKPEHQNRLFSLVHERRIQGIALASLRYRWAAMNPCTADQDGAAAYIGSEPLDPALADRFGLIVPVGDWQDLGEPDRKLIANPAGEGRVANDAGRLGSALQAWREQFVRAVDDCPESIVEYVCAVVTALGEACIRVSPRRARLLSRSLLACRIVEQRLDEATVLRVLGFSLPHVAWGEALDASRIKAAHRIAWDAAMASGREKWVHRFARLRGLDAKVELLLSSCPDPDTGTLVIEQLLAHEDRVRAGAFALAVYPAAVLGRLPIGAEGVTDLGRVASEILTVDGEIKWQERLSESGTTHPQLPAIGRALAALSGAARLERAQQLFNWCLVNNLTVAAPDQLEADFNRCVERVAEWPAS